MKLPLLCFSGKMALPVIDLDEQERAETIRRSSDQPSRVDHAEHSKLHLTFSDKTVSSHTAMLEELPSPPAKDDVPILSNDSMKRNSWTQRNSSFRLATDDKLRLVEVTTCLCIYSTCTSCLVL